MHFRPIHDTGLSQLHRNVRLEHPQPQPKTLARRQRHERIRLHGPVLHERAGCLLRCILRLQCPEVLLQRLERVQCKLKSGRRLALCDCAGRTIRC